MTHLAYSAPGLKSTNQNVRTFHCKIYSVIFRPKHRFSDTSYPKFLTAQDQLLKKFQNDPLNPLEFALGLH